MSKPLEKWQLGWMRSRRSPYIFATEVLGIMPHDPEAAKLSRDDFEKKFGADAAMLEKWQDEFLRAFADNDRHSITAGHGVGKGMILAVLALWFPLTHWDSKTVMTANSENQLRDNNWPEMRKWAAKLPEPLREQLQIDEERAYIKAAPEMVFVVRRTASGHKSEALQGIHARHVLYLIDEASGIAEIIFEVAQGSLSTEGAIAVLFSNPTKARGFFYDTHHVLRSLWRTWRVSSEDVPRARGHIAGIIAKWGKDSNKYRVRVLGLFPTKDDDTVIALELIEAAKGRKVDKHKVYPVWGVDVARFGDDRSTLVKREGNHIVEPPKVWRNLDGGQLAGRIVKEYEATEIEMRPKCICVDVLGVGYSVSDFLIRDPLLQHDEVTILSVNVAESAANNDVHFRLRDELWFKAADWFQAKDCCITIEHLNKEQLAVIEELVAELATPTYDFTASGKQHVMTKDDMKKDLGHSPDIADGFVITFAAPTYPRPVERHRSRWENYDSQSGSAWGA